MGPGPSCYRGGQTKDSICLSFSSDIVYEEWEDLKTGELVRRSGDPAGCPGLRRWSCGGGGSPPDPPAACSRHSPLQQDTGSQAQPHDGLTALSMDLIMPHAEFADEVREIS
jgi:hypothetical protein